MALRPLNLIACQNCGMPIVPHRVCRNCGFYKGREVIDVLAKLDKKERKKREKVLRQQKEAHAAKEEAAR
jgi:large subunit ribosomal protein L32